ncbi:phosphatidate cytidylyltransferase [Treponema pedis]|nr:phosphatidate cytidylyltransferase [Treponema pedis]
MLISAAVIANFEIYNILSQKIHSYPPKIMSVFGSVLILLSYFAGLKFFSGKYLFDAFGIIIAFIMISEAVFSFGGTFTNSISRLASGIFMLLYPWGLSIYLSVLTVFPNANKVLLIFYLMTFASDSIAWFFGMILGKNNRGLIKASPKKSIAGFIGGYAGPVAVAFLVHKIFYKEFGGKLTELIILSVLTASAAILGDMIESILKRSADVKDSGKIILGRGGILDSLDSLLLAAPVFYVSFKFLFGGR